MVIYGIVSLLETLITFFPPFFPPFGFPDAMHTGPPLIASFCFISLLYVLLSAICPALLILKEDFSVLCLYVLPLIVRRGAAFQYT